MAIKLVFFATPNIALKSLVELYADKNFEILAFVCQNLKPSGRGNKIVKSELMKFAEENNIEIIEVERISKNLEVIEKLKGFGADFFVTFAFGQILSQEIIDIPKFGIINLHASLLPKYRGANPIREPLLNGDKETGVTTMLTSLKMDEGDICLSEKIELQEDTNSIELTEKISEISPNLIKKTLLGLYQGEITPIPQNHNEATYTKKTLKEDKILNFNESATTLHNKVRALIDNFTCQTTYKGKIVKVLKTTVCKDFEGTAGEVLRVDKQGILVACRENSLLIQKIKPEGKGEMDAYSWTLGSKIQAGDKFDENN